MSQTVKKHSELLRALCKLDSKERIALLKSLEDKKIHCVCECIYNTLKGKIPLSTKQKTRLSRHKSILRKLVKPGESIKKKRKVLLQTGGALLPLILTPLLSALLGNLFK